MAENFHVFDTHGHYVDTFDDEEAVQLFLLYERPDCYYVSDQYCRPGDFYQRYTRSM